MKIDPCSKNQQSTAKDIYKNTAAPTLWEISGHTRTQGIFKWAALWIAQILMVLTLVPALVCLLANHKSHNYSQYSKSQIFSGFSSSKILSRIKKLWTRA